MIKIIVLSIICESVWQTLKMSFQKDKYLTIDNVGAIVTGLVVSFATNLDILSIIGINTSIPYVGIILTGILMSRGSNFIHDLLLKVQSATNTNLESNDTTESINEENAAIKSAIEPNAISNESIGEEN